MHGARVAGLFLAVLGMMTARAWGQDAVSEWRGAKADFAARQWPRAESRLYAIWRQTSPHSAVEEAGVLLADVYLRRDKLDEADALIWDFRRRFPASRHLPRMVYDQGLVDLKRGFNAAAAQAFAEAAAQARTREVYEAAARALRHLVEGQGLEPGELEAVTKRLADDPALSAWLPGAPRPTTEGGRFVLLMAPFSGEFSEVGQSLREGVFLALEEAKARGAAVPAVRILDDQGDLVLGVLRLRELLRAAPPEAVLGPAMSDVAAGVAIELSAGGSPVPLITPTATTHGIASLGEGVFQLNVTTHVLGRRIAEYAADCLGLRDFAIVAPRSEYGFQLAEAFAETVRSKGGEVAAVAYVDPEAPDLSEPLEGLRQKLARVFFEKRKRDGFPPPDARLMRSYLSDSIFPVGGIFIPAASGDEADKLASQVLYRKIRGQLLGSSGWHDKSLFLKNSEATQGAFFSVDFQDQPKTEAYAAFSRAYKARWNRAPDRVAALSYDAARFLLRGMETSPQPRTLIPALRGIRTFPGVLGDIVFGEEGVNRNTALFRLERRSFREVRDCAQ